MKKHLIFASISMALAVALGALGAHGLKSVLTEASLQSFKTGVFYQIVHAIALLTIAGSSFYSAHLNHAIRFIKIGTILFSGSIYLLCLLPVFGININKYIGFITPIGGVCLIVGWILLTHQFVRKAKN